MRRPGKAHRRIDRRRMGHRHVRQRRGGGARHRRLRRGNDRSDAAAAVYRRHGQPGHHPRETALCLRPGSPDDWLPHRRDSTHAPTSTAPSRKPVAMVVLLGNRKHLSAVRLEEIAAVCKPRGIPIMVDAASEHIERPSPWLTRGADLAIYSGGSFCAGRRPAGSSSQQAALPAAVAQRLAAPGAGPADESVEGGHRRRHRRAGMLVRARDPGRRAQRMGR